MTKQSYHFEEGISRARLCGQVKRIGAMEALLGNYEQEGYYRSSRRQYDRPNTNRGDQRQRVRKWGKEDDETFKLIKNKFLDNILHHPVFNKRFYIDCDASDVSIGGELYQEDNEGNHLVLSFASLVVNATTT